MIELTMPMPCRGVVSHQEVTENAGRVALERGPLVYCLESADNGQLKNVLISDASVFEPEDRQDFLNGLTVLRNPKTNVTAIPYYAWSHRGPGEMAVWLPRDC